MGYLLQQSSTTRPLLFLMVQSSDHINPLTGASPTVTLSKNGASFASPAGAVTEIANGWYKVAGNATDTGTTGPLLLHATAASGDPCDMEFEVVAFNPDTTAAGGIPVVGTGTNNFKSDASANVTFANTSIATVTTVTNQIALATIVSGIWQDTTAGDFTTALSVGKSIMNGVTLGTGLTVNSVTGGATATAVASLQTTVNTINTTVSTNLDTTVSSRSTLTQTQVSGGAYAISSSSFAFNAGLDLTTTQKASVTTAATTATPSVTVSDKSGFSLASSQTFNNTGAWTGNVSGTVTTVTNLTNAPTAGDLTATMKTSVTTAATAATPIAASVAGAVGSVTGLTASNLDATVSSRLSTANSPNNYKKNTAVDQFAIPMRNTDGTLFDGLASAISVVGTIDGVVNNPSGTIVKAASGRFYIPMSAGDMNGNVLCYMFTASGCIPRDYVIRTQP